MTDLLDQLPGVPYLQVADRLSDDVAALQVIWMQFAEADSDAKLRRAAMDSLSRDIRQHLPDGWRQGSRGDFQTARAFANWAVRLCQHRAELRTKADATWDAIEASRPPLGWLPSGPDDALIVAAFSIGWPASDV